MSLSSDHRHSGTLDVHGQPLSASIVPLRLLVALLLTVGNDCAGSAEPSFGPVRRFSELRERLPTQYGLDNVEMYEYV